MPTMTDEQIDALTMADVEAAKAASKANRETRAGLSMRDFILCQCLDEAQLAAAKAYLRDHYDTPASTSLGTIYVDATYPPPAGRRVFVLDIEPHVVMSGEHWLPGVKLRGTDFDGQTIEYAINEGRVFQGEWDEYDDDDESFAGRTVLWRVRPEGTALLRQHGIVEPVSFDRAALEEMIRAIGIGFHADTPVEDYGLPEDDAVRLYMLLLHCRAAGQDANAIAIEVLGLDRPMPR